MVVPVDVARGGLLPAACSIALRLQFSNEKPLLIIVSARVCLLSPVHLIAVANSSPTKTGSTKITALQLYC